MIAIPYHLGRRAVEVGLGPLAILETLDCPCVLVERTNLATPELEAVADINAALTQAVSAHPKPVVILAGNCTSSLGTLAALDDPGIVWLDAHGDFNTPETSISGALEGMSLAVAAGHCHTSLMPRPVAEENVVLAATRSLDPLEEVLLHSSKITLATLDAFPRAVDLLAARVQTIYLHLDLDVLDPEISPGVNFSAPGGITPDQLFDAVHHVISTGKLAAVAIANFNPAKDRDHRTRDIARQLVACIGGFVNVSPP